MGNKSRVIEDLALIVGFVGTAIGTAVAIRANVQIAVVLCLLGLLVIFFIWGFRLHTHRSGGILPSPDSTKIRRYGGYLLLVPLSAVIILLVIPGTSNYVYTAFAGTPTPTIAVPSPTPAVAGASVGQTALQATPSPTPFSCFCQKSTDNLTIKCLIDAESQAANTGSMDVISSIFSPEATVFRGNDPQRTWKSAAEYYEQSFGEFDFGFAEHVDIAPVKTDGKIQYYASGSKGYYQKSSEGTVTSYDNPSPSEHWTFAKNEQGCWQVIYYEFNAAHLPFPREN